MCSHPVRGLLFVAILSLLPAAASAQLKRINQATTSGAFAAVVVPEELPLLLTTQLLPIGADNQLVGAGDAAAQIAEILKQLNDLLRLSNLSLERVVKLNVAAKNRSALETLQKTLAAAFGEHLPAISGVVSDLRHTQALVALDAVVALDAIVALDAEAQNPGGLPDLSRTRILPPGQRVFVSGQSEPGELLVATRKTMEGLAKTLESLDLTRAAIVQVKAFVNPMARANEVRDEIAKFFDGQLVPPMVLIDGKLDSPIEIEVVAAGGPARSGDSLDFITPPWMKPSPVFSRVVRINHGPIIYVGGLYGPAGASPGVQITNIFHQLSNTLTAHGSDLRHLVKATYLCTGTDTIKALGALRPNYYDPQRPPGASLSLVSGTGRSETTITLDMIAVPKPKDTAP
jgi:enamine deaminase RidA (YjgF/YER057c/UK114 family)